MTSVWCTDTQHPEDLSFLSTITKIKDCKYNKLNYSLFILTDIGAAEREIKRYKNIY